MMCVLYITCKQLAAKSDRINKIFGYLTQSKIFKFESSTITPHNNMIVDLMLFNTSLMECPIMSPD